MDYWYRRERCPIVILDETRRRYAGLGMVKCLSLPPWWNSNFQVVNNRLEMNPITKCIMHISSHQLWGFHPAMLQPQPILLPRP